MQKSFNGGEWAPQLYSRVDIEKYHSAAALLRNFFVDYRGGASTRAGTRYVLQAFKSNSTVRLIGFQASQAVSYILEFGDKYLRFINNGSPILGSTLNITGATRANPCVVSVTNSFSVGDWVFISGAAGMTQLNNNYYQISARSAGTITLADLNGVAINSTAYGVYTSGGTVARVYTIATPYAAADLAKLKFVQNVNSMILCHPSYPPQVLTLIAFNNWTILPITFGSSAGIPTGLAAGTSLGAGSVNYSYKVTSVNANGEESGAATVSLASLQDLRSTPGSNSISWNAVAGAQSYNVYKSDVSYFGAVPSGVPYGFVGNCVGTSLIDTNLAPDYSQTPPIATNPFVGGSITGIAVSAQGTGYTIVPTVTLTGGTPALAGSAQAVLGIIGQAFVSGGSGYVAGDILSLPYGILIKVQTVSLGVITSATIYNSGSATSGAVPTAAVASTGGTGSGATFNLTWGVILVNVLVAGNGYSSAPTVTFSSGAATANASITASSTNDPGVPGFFQQRLFLGASDTGPGTFNLSQPGAYYDFDVSNPSQANDAIEASLVSEILETIKSVIATAAGLILLTDKRSWLLNGGSLGSGISPSALVANPQSGNGANDMPPILNNFDILFVENCGNIVRDSTYNFYANVFTGTDISVLASHLFFGFQLLEWAWAQSPFKIVWAVRDDGALLSLTFAKEQEFVAWAHHDTAGLFKSVATVIEPTSLGYVNALYVVVQRTVNGNVVKYIERMTGRYYPVGLTDAWCVDAGLQYNGVATLTFSGAQHLAAKSVTGLATDDLGNVTLIAAFVMPTSGTFSLAAPASPATGYTRVTIGLGFVAQLGTLPLDTGEPTIQSKMKKINAGTIRVAETLDLSIGTTLADLVPMKDLVIGNVGSMSNAVVTDLFTGDARTFLDPKWQEAGTYFIQQVRPYPATITGVIPQLTVGDDK